MGEMPINVILMNLQLNFINDIVVNVSQDRNTETERERERKRGFNIHHV